MEQARENIVQAKAKNKTDQEVERIRRQLTIMESNIDKRAECWEAKEIFAFLMILEKKPNTQFDDDDERSKIVTKSLERKFSLLKSIFSMYYIPIPALEERKIRMALNEHIRNRIDKSINPTKDQAAPMLSPVQWVRIQRWLNDEANTNTKNFKNKKYMAMLSISIGFSTGLRLSEIHRLKYSDLDLNGETEIRIRIRRSKSNRIGHKKVWNVAPGYEAEPLLCPIRNLLLYVENTEKIMYPGAYIFANDPEGTKLTRIENLVTYWRKGAAGAGLAKCHWPEAHSHHNAKINMARALGYSEDSIMDAMNWCSVSVLLEDIHLLLRVGRVC